MTLKATWLWNGSVPSGRTMFGFSETWYTDDSPSGLLPKMEAFAADRVSILARGVSLYGYRIQDVAPGSRAYTVKPNREIQGRRAQEYPNVPQDAALCKCYGTVAGTLKRFWFHVLPDDMVASGDFNPTSNVEGGARGLINSLAAKGFKFRYINQAAATANVVSIDAAGNVVTNQAVTGVAVNSVVQLLKVKGVDGRAKRGFFTVDTVTDTSHFKLRAWDGGVVGVSGKIRIVQYAFTSIELVPDQGFNSDPTIRPGVRKCGRPFGQLRGRVTARS